MSYCRFGDGDLYVYADVGGYICCCACFLDPNGKDAQLYTAAEAIAHVQEHINAGWSVPDDVIPALAGWEPKEANP